MNHIKRLQSQSLLKEVLQEVFFDLSDNRLNALTITRTECSNGKESAKIFIDSAGLNDTEKREILKLLKKANATIRQYLQHSLSWYKVPILSYEFDDEVEQMKRLDEIFKRIHKKDGDE